MPTAVKSGWPKALAQEKLAGIQKESNIPGSAKGMIISQDNQLVIDPKVLLNFIDQAEIKLAP